MSHQLRLARVVASASTRRRVTPAGWYGSAAMRNTIRRRRGDGRGVTRCLPVGNVTGVPLPLKTKVFWTIYKRLEGAPVMQQPPDKVRAASDRRKKMLTLPGATLL